MLRKTRTILLGVTAVCAPAFAAGWALRADDSDDAPIRYSTTQPNDPITRLQKQIDGGTAKLSYQPGSGYLKSVLRALNISMSSQMLVFSKTSFQRELISPEAPRALYFREGTFIGFVQNAPYLEVATSDPQLGAVFYVLAQDGQKPPRFIRQTHECLQCHESGMTKSVPGHLMRSVYPDANGQPIFTAGTHLTTDESPLKERWGGWYVTGTHGSQRHMGNVLFKDEAEANQPDAAMERGANVTNLKSLVNTSTYPTGYSDIVALMVAEHETSVLNLLIRANHETRKALNYEHALNKELGRPADYRADSTLSRIKSVAEPLMKAMLFSKEAPLEAPVVGTSGFSAQFANQGPRDKDGRSLRQFDLRKRLFRYPLSYLIYSDAFDGLPAMAKEYVYRRIWEVLTEKDTTGDFAHLSSADRKSLLEILTETKPDFAAFARLQR